MLFSLQRQAIRYKQYADEVYVAISSEFVGKVDKELLRSMKIGLIRFLKQLQLG